jgi:hypothetical protein
MLATGNKSDFVSFEMFHVLEFCPKAANASALL